jgi:adhesin/invasin
LLTDKFSIGTKIVKIVFTTSSQTITAGAASAVMTIQTQGLLGSPSNVDEDTIIALSSTSITGTFSSAAAPWVDIALRHDTRGENSVSFYYKDTAAGTPTITAAEYSSQGWTDVA